VFGSQRLSAPTLIDTSLVFKPQPKSGPVPGGSRWLLGRPKLVEEPATTTGKDLVRDGYGFFAGRLALEKDVTLSQEPSPDAVLVLPPFSAVTALVKVNDQEAGTVWKSPRTVPVGGLLRRGRNRVAITLTTGLRNMLGPHHNPEVETRWIGPSSFRGSTGWYGHGVGSPGVYRHDYNVVDFGLGGDVVLRY
jgi:hypothetical protein